MQPIGKAQLIVLRHMKAHPCPGFKRRLIVDIEVDGVKTYIGSEVG